MAAGAVRGALRQQDIEALMDGAPPERPLPMYYFLDNPDNPTMRITAFIVRLRAGGFMVAMPGTDEVGELLSNLSETGDPAAPLLFTPLQVACETPRRRALGEITLHFVDIPWAWLGFLRSGAALRGSTLELVCIKVDGVTARPNSDGARAAADLWVATAIEDPELQDSGLGEYVTGAEDLDGLPLTEAPCRKKRATTRSKRMPASFRVFVLASMLSRWLLAPGPWLEGGLAVWLDGRRAPKLGVGLATFSRRTARPLLPRPTSEHFAPLLAPLP